MNKSAFITMDVESFFDTSCIKKHGINPDEKYDCAEEIDKFIDFLNAQNIKATFFVTASFLSRCKDFLKKAIMNNHEIALHCLNHEPVTSKTVTQFEIELKKAKSIIENELNIEIKGFRFPCFEYNNEYFEIIKNNGFLYDSSMVGKQLENASILNDSVSYDGQIYEFSLASTKLLFFNANLSGGGYLRLVPWNIGHAKIKKYIKSHNAFVLYFHPFEIHEGNLPKYKELNIFEKLYVKRGRDSYLNKISQVIEELKNEGFDFYTMSEYIKRNIV